MMATAQEKTFEEATRVFRDARGILRTGEGLKRGIHPRTLYAMRDAGLLERLERGLYRLAELDPLSSPDLVTVALKIPDGVICLISALSFHDITTQIPHTVHVAIKRGAEPPRISYPPTKIYWFSGERFTSGIETHVMDHARVRIYSPEKTLADCFKYRHKIGKDTVLEALTLYRERKKSNPRELLRYARICRVESVMRPYLEMLLAPNFSTLRREG